MGVYLWNASTGAISQLFELDSDHDDEFITGLKWIEGCHLAMGNNAGSVLVSKLLRF